MSHTLLRTIQIRSSETYLFNLPSFRRGFAGRSPASVSISVDDDRGGFVNGTDSGARMRLPLFLRETPDDTGVTRGVKRAATSLDALGIKLGVFLRRYPIARYFFVQNPSC